jgi:flagellar biosynthesis/type III secretory pathway M-ring protein FliF/YscJ
VVLVLLLLLVVKPLVKNIMAAPQQVLVQAAPGGASGEGGAGAPSRPTNAIAYEQQIAQARSLVAKDPARVAQVVTDWVQKDE